MAIKINELPVDVNLTGTEKIPAQEENGTGVSITTQAISTYVERNIVQSPVTTTVANTFARQYPVQGSIAKGQGVHVFIDDDDVVKMKASDNSDLTVTRGVDDSFPTNINDFRQDLGVNEDVKVYPIVNDVYSILPDVDLDPFSAPSDNGVFVTFVANADGSGYEWHPDESIGDGTTLRLRDVQYGNTVDFYRATIDSAGEVTVYLRNWVINSSQHGIYFRQLFTETGTSLFSSSVRLRYGTYANSTFSMGTVTPSQLTASNLRLSFYFANAITSKNASFTYRVNSAISAGTHSHRNITTARETDGALSVTLVQDPAVLTSYRWDPSIPAGVGAAFLMGSLGYGRLIRNFTVGSISFDTDTNILSVGITDRNSTLPSLFYEFLTGTDRLAITTSAETLGSVLNIQLTGTQASNIATNNYQIGFKFATTDDLTDPLLKFNEIEDVTNITDTHTINFPIKQYLNTDTTVATTSLTTSNTQTFRITDTKVLIKTRLATSSIFNVLIPKTETVNSIETVTVDKVDKVLQTRGIGQGSQQVLMIYEKVNNVWTKQNVFFPCFSQIHKTDKDVRNWAQSYSYIEKYKEDDNEIVFALCNNSRYRTSQAATIEFEGFPFDLSSINNLDELSDNDYVQFVRVSKTDNSIEYILNDTEDPNSISNFFSGFKISTLPNTTISVIAEVGTENNNVFKVVVLKSSRILLYQIIKGTLGTHTTYTTSLIVNAGFPPSAQTTDINQFHYYDPSTFTFYFIDFVNAYRLNKVYLNSDLTDFRRRYNTTTQLFNSDNSEYVSRTIVGSTLVLTNNLIDVVANNGFNNTEFLFDIGFSNNTFRSATYNLYNTGTFFNINLKSASKTFFSFNNGSRNVIYQRAPINCLSFYSGDVLEMRLVDANSLQNSFNFNFSPANAIGLSAAAYSDGDTGTLAYLAGSSLITISGGSFVIGADYYIDNVTGILNARAGRRLGRAISQTEILINA